MIKQAMLRTAKRLKHLSITEQGAGVFDLDAFFNYLLDASNMTLKNAVVKNNNTTNYTLMSSSIMIHPKRIDLRSNSTYFLPFSR